MSVESFNASVTAGVISSGAPGPKPTMVKLPFIRNGPLKLELSRNMVLHF